MSCDRRLLSAYRDGELTLDQRRDVDEHLRGCAECGMDLHELGRLADEIRSMPIRSVPTTMRSELRRRIADHQAERRRIGPLGGFLRAAAPTFAAAATAAAVLIALRPSADGPPAPLALLPIAGAPMAAPSVASQPAGLSPSVPTWHGTRVGSYGSASAIPPRMEGAPPSIARLYAGNTALREQLGIPAEGSKTVTLVEQSFQGGMAIRRGDTHEVYVLNRTGNAWSVYVDAKRAGDRARLDAVPPPGAMVPAVGFGSLWRSHPEVKEHLGWAVYEPRGSGGAIQAFERGLIIWSPHGLLYVLSDDGTWKTYPDASPL